MNEQRETKEITTPLGKQKIVMHTWVTGGERIALKQIFLKGMKLDAESGKPDTKDMDLGDLTLKAEMKAIEVIVVSVDNDKEDIAKRLLEMRDTDYDFVTKEINKISSDKDFTTPVANKMKGINTGN